MDPAAKTSRCSHAAQPTWVGALTPELSAATSASHGGSSSQMPSSPSGPRLRQGHPWERLLHNQSALRLKSRLLFQPALMVTSVPYQLQPFERDTAAGTAPPA